MRQQQRRTTPTDCEKVIPIVERVRRESRRACTSELVGQGVLRGEKVCAGKERREAARAEGTRVRCGLEYGGTRAGGARDRGVGRAGRRRRGAEMGGLAGEAGRERERRCP